MNEESTISNNSEIDKALKEFEVKSQAEQMKKASEVSKDSETSKMVQLVMKWSGVKEQKQAEYILLGFVILALVMSGFLVFGGRSKTKIEAPPGYKIIYPPNAPPRLDQPVQ